MIAEDRMVRIERLRNRIRQPYAPSRSRWAWFFDAEQAASILKNSLLATVLIALVGSYIQFNAGRQERRLAFVKEDYGAAYSAFQEILLPLNTLVTLQQILFFTFLETAEKAGQDPFLQTPQDDLVEQFKEYTKVRTSMRSKIDILAVNALMHLDWPLQTKGDKAIEAINSQKLGPYGFDCYISPNIPNSFPANNGEQLLEHKGQPSFTINWRSANHQAIAAHHCSESVHHAIFMARSWASKRPITLNESNQFMQTTQVSIKLFLTKQLERIKAFEQLGIWKMSAMREEYETTSFFCHMFDVRSLCE